MPLERKSKDPKVRELKQLAPTVFDMAEKYLNEHYEIRKNTVLDTIEIKSKGSSERFHTMDDEANLYIELQKNRVNISLDKLRALLKSDFVHRFDPILEYFESLPKWDGKIDVINQVADHIKVSEKDRNRFNLQFKKMLVRTIACALDPKVFNKQIFVLIQQQQNTGKSTFLRWLCPDQLEDYYTENINFDDKDSNIAITENFLINIDELATLHRTEINKLKSFISKVDDKSRRAYAARAVRRERRASFVASTNDVEFLTDTTGNVRWICFEIDGIAFNYKTKYSVKDLWSQAYSLYNQEFEYQLTTEEVIENELVNTNFMKLPPEAEIVNKYFMPGTKEEHDYFLNSSDIANMIGTLFNIRNINIVRIGMSMGYLGFHKQTKWRKNTEKSYSVKGYYVKLDEEEKLCENIKDHFDSRLNKKTPF